MAKHGDFFPENPQNVDELIDALAQRSAAAQRMLNSMSPEQREELMQLSAQAFGSPQLMQQLARLDANLQALRPGEDWGGSERFEGDQGLGLGDGTGVLQDLADLDDLADQLSQSYGGARLDDVDLDKLARQLGDQAAVDARDPAGARAGAADDRHAASAASTASCGSPRRRCASSARRCCATSRSGCPVARDSGTCARPVPRATCPGSTRRVAVRRHRAVGHPAHRAQRRAAAAPVTPSRSAALDRGRRGRRDRGPHPGRGRAAASTRPSRWRWTAAGCR